MADIAKLLTKLTHWSSGRDALAQLAKLPLATKRAQVYPRVVELAVKYWGGEEDKSFEVENFVKFIIPELAVEPELANMIYTAMNGNRPAQFLDHFYTLAGQARDRRAAPLLEGLWKQFPYHWAEAVIGIDTHELADDVTTLLAARKQHHERDVGPCAGLYGGPKALAELRKQSKDDFISRPDSIALGLALAGHVDDKYFKKVSTRDYGLPAKRLHAALHATPKDRKAAFDAFETDVKKPKANVTPGMQLALCRMLAAEDPVIVERAAGLLATYVKGLASYLVGKPEEFHAYFLSSAQAAITRGVAPNVRASLDKVQREIPRAAPFVDGPVTAPAQPVPDARQVARENRARERLAAMGVELPAAKPATSARKRRSAPRRAKARG